MAAARSEKGKGEPIWLTWAVLVLVLVGLVAYFAHQFWLWSH